MSYYSFRISGNSTVTFYPNCFKSKQLLASFHVLSLDVLAALQLNICGLLKTSNTCAVARARLSDTRTYGTHRIGSLKTPLLRPKVS